MFSIKNLIAVMPESSGDLTAASYLNFLASKIPIDKVTNFHVYTAVHLFKALNEQSQNYGEMLLERVKETMSKNLVDSYPNISKSITEVVAGNQIAEILRKTHHCKPDLIALGEKTGSDFSLAKQITRHIPCKTLIIPEKAQNTLKHILIPVDLSEHSTKLLQAGLQLRKWLNDEVKITCYHAFEMPNIPSYSLLRTEGQFHEIVKKNNIEALHKFVEKNQAQVEEVVQEEVVDRPDRAILDYMAKNNVDFLILGTKGHSGLEAFLGSTVERVISKNDKVPMLIVK